MYLYLPHPGAISLSSVIVTLDCGGDCDVYECQGLQPPVNLYIPGGIGRFTGGSCTGVSIFGTAGWATPRAFVTFYCRDVIASSLAHSTLSVGS